jgi:DNA adenine methylase
VTDRHGLTAIFLDPPYQTGEHAMRYAGGGGVWEAAWAWALEHGENPLLRIAICGYDDGRSAPDGWQVLRWKARGGYGSQGKGRGRANAGRETIWFSPHCLNPAEEARDMLTKPITARAADWSGTLFEEAA